MIEPCGCGGNNNGGLPRRATYIKTVRAENRNCTLVDNGNLTASSDPALRLEQMKAVATIYKMMNYDAIGVGSLDLILGDNFYNELGNKGIPIIQIDTAHHDRVQPYIVKKSDGIRVGIISFGVTGSTKADAQSLMDTRLKVLEEARAKSDILILLDQANVATDRWLEDTTKHSGCPDVVIGGKDRLPYPLQKSIGQSIVAPTSSRGDYIGRIDIEITGSNKKIICSRVPIEESIKEDPEVKAIAQAYKDRQKVASITNTVANQQMSEYSYRTCKNCHLEKYKQWNKTPHANSVHTLQSQGKMLSDCLQCHSETYKKDKECRCGWRCGMHLMSRRCSAT